MKEKPQELPALEQGLLTAMQAIDNQIAREMQRNPQQREQHGVQKWEPYNTRIERITAFVMNSLGGSEVDLDSVLVLYQTFSKAVQMVIEDLGEDGLGKVRSSYCQTALESVARDCRNGLALLQHTPELT